MVANVLPSHARAQRSEHGHMGGGHRAELPRPGRGSEHGWGVGSPCISRCTDSPRFRHFSWSRL
jgi:hypothetical protein